MEDVRVVGIHHRRGDHLDYERVYRIPHITMAYLGPSMDLYLEKHNNSVLFLYVSDDKEWGEKYLARDRNVVLSLSDNTEPGPWVYILPRNPYFSQVLHGRNRGHTDITYYQNSLFFPEIL